MVTSLSVGTVLAVLGGLEVGLAVELGAVWACACRPHAQAMDIAKALRVNKMFIQIFLKNKAVREVATNWVGTSQDKQNGQGFLR